MFRAPLNYWKPRRKYFLESFKRIFDETLQGFKNILSRIECWGERRESVDDNYDHFH